MTATDLLTPETAAPLLGKCAVVVARNLRELTSVVPDVRYISNMQNRTLEFVYFVKAVGSDFVKIGYAQHSPTSRIDALQVGCPYELKLIGFVAGNPALERHLHQRFGRYRVRGEWFIIHQALLDFLAQAHEERLKDIAPRIGVTADAALAGTWAIRRPSYIGGRSHFFPAGEDRSLCGSIATFPLVPSRLPHCAECGKRATQRAARKILS